MSVDTDLNKPKFEGPRWITSEDVNVEHLLDVFTATDLDSEGFWDACADFVRHLAHQTAVHYFEAEDLHRSQPRCLFQLLRLFRSAGD